MHRYCWKCEWCIEQEVTLSALFSSCTYRWYSEMGLWKLLPPKAFHHHWWEKIHRAFECSQKWDLHYGRKVLIKWMNCMWSSSKSLDDRLHSKCHFAARRHSDLCTNVWRIVIVVKSSFYETIQAWLVHKNINQTDLYKWFVRSSHYDHSCCISKIDNIPCHVFERTSWVHWIHTARQWGKTWV